MRCRIRADGNGDGHVLALLLPEPVVSGAAAAIVSALRASLPDLPITVVHRADESGTTENFVEYLAADRPAVSTPIRDVVSGYAGGKSDMAKYDWVRTESPSEAAV